MESKQVKTALVTGGTGFLGHNFVKFLLERGWKVVCLVRAGSRCDILREMGADLVVGNFTEPETLKKAVNGVDTVFHLAGATAARNQAELLKVNCEYTENLVQACVACASKPTFVYVSSLAAAGPSTSQHQHTEEDAPCPVSWYGKSKLAAETMLKGYADRLPITVIRPPMLFGPYDHEVRKWITTIRNTGIFFIPFLRTFRFSMAHAEDVCEMLVLVAMRGERLDKVSQKTGQGIYYVSQPDALTYMEMGSLFGKSLGRKFTFILPITPIIMFFLCQAGWLLTHITGRVYTFNPDKFREVSAGSWSCSADKARQQLGFQNLHTLEEQCRSTVEWIRKQ